MKKSFQRLNMEFRKQFGTQMSYRAVFDKEFFKRFSTVPQRNTAKDRGTIVTVKGTDYYLLPGEKAVPGPDVQFEGVEVYSDITVAERQWLDRNLRRHGWTALPGHRMGNPNLLLYIAEYDHYADAK